ncbi:hypothetical protein CMI40_00005 [Candidatus Pacearchaeota archaeon]|jgi:hypothetical protein|nr:hypothetical protein [Candidatus Pacearchaeota archaeon]|tara:strand:+ start:5136 stop:5375 length:240 start_codon:yes stop_codon:yes gene_type:complete
MIKYLEEDLLYTQGEVDEVLEKVSMEGIDMISIEDMNILGYAVKAGLTNDDKLLKKQRKYEETHHHKENLHHVAYSLDL